jgi:hypothetical protein
MRNRVAIYQDYVLRKAANGREIGLLRFSIFLRHKKSGQEINNFEVWATDETDALALARVALSAVWLVQKILRCR